MIFLIFTLFLNLDVTAKTCSYEYQVWNRWKSKSEKRVVIKKDYKKLEDTEKGPLGCTPCKEDQQKVTLSNGLSFDVCKKIAEDIQAVLETSLAEGFPVTSVLGYRPQMSKGELDPEGYRTELSHHSFGVAIDVNREQNGLYDNCIKWGRGCRLIQGGKYNPQSRLSIKEGSLLVTLMRQVGLKWGGKIRGRQKDFMHFSPSGY